MSEPMYDLNRDHSKLEPHYSRHIMAMTTEELYYKSDIAAELAYRDAEIERLKARLTPDREDIAWRLFKAHTLCGETKGGRAAFEEHKPLWLRQADAAIAAMRGGE